ncbi:MAG: glycoside hydrolase family 3 C-terminal domain-containing protein [Actinomycetaceae bacterium]|nr:glycoside hydrolase family 3 C-terminal domain-containing protein [Actinomycetaceae bacterium]
MNIADRLHDLVHELTLDEKISLLAGRDNWSVAGIERIGLRPIITSDGPVGVRGTDWDDRKSSANTPSPTGLAATWNDELMEKVGNVLANEADKKGVDVILAPTINLHRTPVGGRHFECMSEDPALTGGIASAYVRGIQNGGKAACLKHFVGNDQETDRRQVNNIIDERTLRELYLSPFEQVQETVGPWTYMTSYNRVNGHFMTESPLVAELIKDEWASDALIMSDWGATRSVAPAINNGLDLAMPGPTTPWDAMKFAVQSGDVPEEIIDEAVNRYLLLAFRVGALKLPEEGELGDTSGETSAHGADGAGGAASGAGGAANTASSDESAADPTRGDGPEEWALDEETRTLMRTLATESFVLARNEGVLPLQNHPKSMAVLGPNARTGRAQGGGSASVFPDRVSHPLDAIRATFTETGVTYSPGVLSTDRVPAASGQFNFVDGRPGLVLEIIGKNGEILDTRYHRTAQFNWVNGFGEDFEPADVAEIRGHTTLIAEEAGNYKIGMSAHGQIRLDVDGTTKISLNSPMPTDTDFVEVIMTPRQYVTEISMREGEEAELEFSFKATGPDEVGNPYWGFQLNIGEPFGDADAELERAVQAAQAAEVAVVVVGTTEEVESEGHDRQDLLLPGRQDELVSRVAEVNKNTIVIVNAGAPVLMPWFEDVAAVLLVWFPGQEMGNAIANVLSGAAEPGGRMPTTWPKPDAIIAPENVPTDGQLHYDEGVYIGYRAYAKHGVQPQVPFGFGLGYTTWKFGEAEVVEPEVGEPEDDEFNPFAPLNAVTVNVTNTGQRPGKTVAQVYVEKLDTQIDRPLRWLVAYSVVYAEPGETKQVTIDIPRRFIEFWNGHDWEAEDGDYNIFVSDHFSPATPS